MSKNRKRRWIVLGFVSLLVFISFSLVYADEPPKYYPNAEKGDAIFRYFKCNSLYAFSLAV